MTREETDRLFDLLALYRPGDRHLTDKQHRALWAFTLEPYSPEDVREAVRDYFQENKFWPDVTDISSRCPKPEKPGKTAETSDRADLDRREWERYRPTRERWERLVQQRREAGLPGTIREAAAAGLSELDWTAELEKAGLAWNS